MLDLGFNCDRSPINWGKEKNTALFFQNFSVFTVCLDLGWVIFKKLNEKLSTWHNHKDNNGTPHFSNTQATLPLRQWLPNLAT